MQELKFGNILSSLFVLIVAAALSIGSSLVNIAVFSLPLPLLIIGLFAGFLILNFVFYPKATTIQTIQLTITGIFLNAIILCGAVFGITYFKLASVNLNSDFVLQINPLIIVVSFIAAFIALITVAKFEEKKAKPEPKKEETEQKSEEHEEPEIVSFEVREAPVSAYDKAENEPQQEVVENSFSFSAFNKEPDNGKKEDEQPKTLYEELYPQSKSKEPQKEETLENPDDCFMEMEELPALNLDNREETEQPESIKTQAVAELPDTNEKLQEEPAQDEEEYFDFIPTDIRLVEAPTAKDNESKGKIASIGKLLVNNRDIEGVIESGEINAEKGAKNNTNIVSSNSGVHFEEKLNTIKQEFPDIKETALIDKGGFILAGNFEDKMKINITGALIAGTYHTMQNYLAQISFKHPEKIFFETENANSFIIRNENEEFLFSTGDKSLDYVEYGELGVFLKEEDISGVDLTPFTELGQIENYTVSDGTGQIIKSAEDSEQSQKLGIVSSALFENLKVFLMNMQLVKLSRITIFNAEEVITIQKFDDKIAAFRTSTDSLIKFSDDFIKIESIYL